MIKLEMENGSLVEPGRLVRAAGEEYDVIVTGGGLAGFGAAVSAAREGCRTLLVESASALGGLATIGLVPFLLDFLSGIGREMFRELEKVDGLAHRHSDPEKHKLVLDRMVRAAGCDLLLVTTVAETIMEGNTVRGVVVESKSGREALLGRRVIDCTGDADTAFHAGARVMVGRPEDGYTQGCSMDFRLGGVDWERYHEWRAQDPKWLEAIRAGLAGGDLPCEIDNHLNWLTRLPGRPEGRGMDEVCICFAHSRHCRPLDNRDLTRMYLEGREQVDILARFIRSRIPGFENSWLVESAPLLGVRDSRRVAGEYVLTARDLASLRKFDDAIAASHHGYDVHGPTGPGNIKWAEMEVDGQTRYVICKASGYGTTLPPPEGAELTNYRGTRDFDPQDFYDIPYRCLLPESIENLLVAGRCLSADFMAQSGSRLNMLCLAMGESAGLAAALSLRNSVPPRRVEAREIQALYIERGGELKTGTRPLPGITG